MNVSPIRLAKQKLNSSSFKVKNGGRVSNTNYLIIRKSTATAQKWTNSSENYKLQRTEYMKNYASEQPHSLSIKDMERFRADCEKVLENECEIEAKKQIKNISNFLVNELLIRCANVIVENKELPKKLRLNDHFKRLEANYRVVEKRLGGRCCKNKITILERGCSRTKFEPHD